jgi:hypothetical protein
MGKHPHGFDPHQYVNTLQAHRAGLAFRDENYDRNRAAQATNPVVRNFYLNEAEIDHRFGVRRETAARTGKPMRAP